MPEIVSDLISSFRVEVFLKLWTEAIVLHGCGSW